MRATPNGSSLFPTPIPMPLLRPITRIIAAAATSAYAAEPPPHWAFQPVERPPLPIVKDTTWPTSPIDHFILARLESQNLTPTSAASPQTLFRRLHFDLTGLPPSQPDTTRFAAPGPATQQEKLAHLTTRLLASPHYGERWGRHWLDVARYADTAGETADFPAPHAWRYRNYVIDAFNSDKPFDQFIREQIAGDILASAPDTTPERFSELTIATGYIAVARRFGFDILADHHLTIEDTLDTIGRSVLGLGLSCARCHDHPFDPVSADDYYGLYGIFESTRYPFPGCEKTKRPSGMTPLVKESPTPEKNLAGKLAELTVSETSQAHQFKSIATSSQSTLADQLVGRGGTKSFRAENIQVRSGAAIQLSIHPRANYGADTTRIEFTITTTGDTPKTWDAKNDTIDRFLASNPDASSTWHFLDVRDGARYLSQPVAAIDNHPGLSAWRRPGADNPSVFANTSDSTIDAWTALPPETLFVHPAPDGAAAITWLSPVDATISIAGTVADGHPGHGDGVRFVLEHFSADLSPTLTSLASISAELAGAHARQQLANASRSIAPVAYAVSEGEPHDAESHLRGDPKNRGLTIPRKNLELLGGQHVTDTTTSGRLDLAHWLTAPGNPLTPRVIANRVWQHHFGTGIVATPDDFGTRGAHPTHPGLLDWLASELVANNWSVKHLHRIILNSSTYRQSSHLPDRSQDGIPRPLFGHVPRRRLAAEEIRDSLLAVSGNLDTTPATAHPFPPSDAWNFTQHTPFIAGYPSNKRSVYLMAQRIRQHPFLSLFDGADSNSTTGRRNSTTVPTQSLFFMNNPFVRTQADTLAKNLLTLPGTTTRITHAYQSTLARNPTRAELDHAESFLNAYTHALDSTRSNSTTTQTAWQAWCRVLLSSNEFLYVD